MPRCRCWCAGTGTDLTMPLPGPSIGGEFTWVYDQSILAIMLQAPLRLRTSLVCQSVSLRNWFTHIELCVFASTSSGHVELALSLKIKSFFQV